MIRISDKIITGTVLLSEISHLFCCVIPTVFSIASLMAGAGAISALPPVWGGLHDTLHRYELPMIGSSAAVLFLGWALHAYSYWVDCRSTGCAHEPCAPKKKRNYGFLLFATGLFLVNVTIYGVFHYLPERDAAHQGGGHEEHSHDHGHDHGQSENH